MTSPCTFTPSGGTNEGANDDTSGSTVSLEWLKHLPRWNLTIPLLLVCGHVKKRLLGTRAYVTKSARKCLCPTYMNFDMVSLNYPIVPLTDPIIDPLTGDIFEPANTIGRLV